MCSFVEELLLGEHDGGLGVGDQHEHVAVQAKPEKKGYTFLREKETETEKRNHCLPINSVINFQLHFNAGSMKRKKNLNLHKYRKGQIDQNMVLNLLRYHHRDK